MPCSSRGLVPESICCELNGFLSLVGTASSYVYKCFNSFRRKILSNREFSHEQYVLRSYKTLIAGEHALDNAAENTRRLPFLWVVEPAQNANNTSENCVRCLYLLQPIALSEPSSTSHGDSGNPRIPTTFPRQWLVTLYCLLRPS